MSNEGDCRTAPATPGLLMIPPGQIVLFRKIYPKPVLNLSGQPISPSIPLSTSLSVLTLLGRLPDHMEKKHKCLCSAKSWRQYLSPPLKDFRERSKDVWERNSFNGSRKICMVAGRYWREELLLSSLFTTHFLPYFLCFQIHGAVNIWCF